MDANTANLEIVARNVAIISILNHLDFWMSPVPVAKQSFQGYLYISESIGREVD